MCGVIGSLQELVGLVSKTMMCGVLGSLPELVGLVSVYYEAWCSRFIARTCRPSIRML